MNFLPRLLVTSVFEDGEFAGWSGSGWQKGGSHITTSQESPHNEEICPSQVVAYRWLLGSSPKTDVDLHHYSWNNGGPKEKSIHMRPTLFV